MQNLDFLPLLYSFNPPPSIKEDGTGLLLGSLCIHVFQSTTLYKRGWNIIQSYLLLSILGFNPPPSIKEDGTSCQALTA